MTAQPWYLWKAFRLIDLRVQLQPTRMHVHVPSATGVCHALLSRAKQPSLREHTKHFIPYIITSEYMRDWGARQIKTHQLEDMCVATGEITAIVCKMDFLHHPQYGSCANDPCCQIVVLLLNPLLYWRRPESTRLWLLRKDCTTGLVQ